MNIFILTSTADQASSNSRAFISKSCTNTELNFDNYGVLKLLPTREKTNEVYLLTTDKEAVYYDDLDASIESQISIKPDLIVFATKHQAKSGIHSLSCHTQGNWGSADFGGKEKEIGVAPATLLSQIFLKLKEVNHQKELGYEVILECTHHGPSLKTPSIFIEIGSDEESWVRKDAGAAISKTLIEILPKYKFDKPNSDIKVALGLGGLHHCPEFSKRYERNEAYVGHVCPKHQLENLTEEILRHAISNIVPKCEMILFDWKGMKDKDRLIPIIEKVAQELDLEQKKTKSF